MDCRKCIKKNSVSSTRGHCTEFIDQPQVDACALMSTGDELPVSFSESEKGSYLWLSQEKNNQTTVQ